MRRPRRPAAGATSAGIGSATAPSIFAAGLRRAALRGAGSGGGSSTGRPVIDAVRRLDQHVVVGQRPGLDVALLDEEPVGRIVGQPHQRPAAGQLLAGQAELQLAGGQRRLRIVGQRHVGAGVPDDHAAGAVVAVRDAALEAGVFERVVLHQLGEAPHLRIEARPLGHRPAAQRPADLQAQVVVHPPRMVLLHHEDRRAGGARAALRLRRLGKAALGAIGLDATRHADKMAGPDAIVHRRRSVRSVGARTCFPPPCGEGLGVGVLACGQTVRTSAAPVTAIQLTPTPGPSPSGRAIAFERGGRRGRLRPILRV